MPHCNPRKSASIRLFSARCREGFRNCVELNRGFASFFSGNAEFAPKQCGLNSIDTLPTLPAQKKEDSTRYHR